MGCIHNITAAEFPQQSKLKGAAVRVCFHYDTRTEVKGKIVRDDEHQTIIALEDGRYVLATECQYSIDGPF